VAILTPEPFPDMPDWSPDAKGDGEAAWRLSEKIVGDMHEEYPDCEVIRDHKVIGKSGVARQIDVWVTGSVAGYEINLAIECKFHKAKVDINLVDSFIGMLQDIGVDKGVFVTSKGFTAGAAGRAKAAGIVLKIISLEDAMETDWAEYLGDGCQTLGCWGRVNWEYSEGGPQMGSCDSCGQFHISCAACGHTDEYDVYCNASVGEAHVRCKGCNACFVVGVEKGDPTDICACTKHKAEDSEEDEDSEEE
jgi:hypothetical protein